MTRLLIPLVAQPAAATLGEPRPDSVGLSVAGPSLSAWVRAVSTSPDPALVLDPRGAVVAASPAAATLFGRPIAELLGRELHRAVAFIDFHTQPHPAEGTGMSLVPIQALRYDTPARGLMRARCPDGLIITLDCVASPLHDSRRHVVGVLVMLTSVTRYRRSFRCCDLDVNRRCVGSKSRQRWRRAQVRSSAAAVASARTVFAGSPVRSAAAATSSHSGWALTTSAPSSASFTRIS